MALRTLFVASSEWSMTPGGGKTGAVTTSWGDDGVILRLEDTNFSFRNGVGWCVSDGRDEGLCLERLVLCVRVP
jgi:hypothetical protein